MVNWTSENQLRLLLAVISTQKISNMDWKMIAEAMGEGYNENGCYQKFNKIKREAAVQFGVNNDNKNGGKGEGSASATPRGRKKKVIDDETGMSTGKMGAGKGRKRVHDDTPSSKVHGDFDDTPSAIKKFKKEKSEDAEDEKVIKYKQEDSEDLENDDLYA